MPHQALLLLSAYSFDICFMNDIAVANSSLIREYSLIDSRGKDLMLIVKRWAKEFKLNSAKDNTISSYTWTIMAIFYLQCLGFVPNLQCRKLMQAVGVTPNPKGEIWHGVDGLDTCTLTWDQIRTAGVWEQDAQLKSIPVAGLLYGFFEFYSRRFPSGLYAVSIKRGEICLPRTTSRKHSFFLCIEDPFETFESYCPHDLGSHASDTGAKDMIQCLNDAEAHLRKVLLGTSKPEECGLWPNPPFVEPLPPRNQKNAQYRRFEPAKPAGGMKQDTNEPVAEPNNVKKPSAVPGEGQNRNQQARPSRRRGPYKNAMPQNDRSKALVPSHGPQNGRHNGQSIGDTPHEGQKADAHGGQGGPRRNITQNGRNRQKAQGKPPGQNSSLQNGQPDRHSDNGQSDGQGAGSQAKKGQGKSRSSRRGRKDPVPTHVNSNEASTRQHDDA
jgi:Cid1 family poly A polymerase